MLAGVAGAACAAALMPADAWGMSGGTPARPNVIVILIDDMGFSDFGCFGSEIPTPNIDALASGGLRFTQFYNSARCSCSRASLLTGAHPHQAGLGHLEAISVPGSRGLHGKLSDRVVTMAEVLGPAGYHTSMAGKWHLGLARGVPPWKRGFERSLTSPIGELYYPDQPQKAAQTVFIDGRELPAGSAEVGNGEWYSSDLFVDWGTRFIAEAQQQKRPFFLYLPFVGVHFPVMAPPDQVARFRGKYRTDWNTLRRARLARQKELGIVDTVEQLPPALAGSYDWNRLTKEQQDRFDGIMAVYAAAVASLDKAIGTLVERLKADGVLDDTVILIMSDNGGNAESGPDGRSNEAPLGSAGSNTFVGMNWATLQNTPFQMFKHYTHEGGISTPLIAHWPKGIKSSLNGTLVRTPCHFIDVMPTVLELSGARYPSYVGGKPIVPVQGRSLVPAFEGRPVRRPGALYWEHEGNRAVRADNWKLVARFGQPWSLYNMHADRSEMADVAASNPQLVRKLADDWDRWAQASYVDPWQESYDIYIAGKARQIWGTADTPAIPDAQI